MDDAALKFTLRIEHSGSLWHMTSPELIGFRVTSPSMNELFGEALAVIDLMMDGVGDMRHAEQKAAWVKAFEGTEKISHG